jgi:hypothetical protein
MAACQMSRLSISGSVRFSAFFQNRLECNKNLSVGLWKLPKSSLYHSQHFFAPSSQVPCKKRHVAKAQSHCARNMHNDTVRNPGESTPLSPKLFAANSAGDEEVPVQKPVDVKEERNKSSFVLPALAVLVAGAMLLGNPSDSLAASSGGRVGGSKFKSSAPSKSYSPSRSGSGGGSGGGGSR